MEFIIKAVIIAFFKVITINKLA